jgi:hypothetical protein
MSVNCCFYERRQDRGARRQRIEASATQKDKTTGKRMSMIVSSRTKLLGNDGKTLKRKKEGRSDF